MFRSRCLPWTRALFTFALTGCGQVFFDRVVEDRPDGEVDGGPTDAADDIIAIDGGEVDAPDGGPLFDAGPCVGQLSVAPSWNGGDPLLIDFNPGQSAVGYTVDAVRAAGDGFVAILRSSLVEVTPQLVLVALNADGTLNSSFGTGGRSDLNVDGTPHSLESARDGGWLISATDNSEPIVVKATAVGALDRSFGVEGVVRPLPPGAVVAAPNSIDRFQDGYLVGGQTRTTAFDLWAALLDEGGEPVTTFGVGGYSLASLGSADEFGLAQPAADAAFYYNAGTSYVDAARGFDCALTRRQADGQPDDAFGASGWAVAASPGRGGCAFVVESAGFVFAGGDYDNGASRSAVYRFTAAGILDTTFGDEGTLLLLPDEVGSVRDLVLLSDGTLVAVGRAGSVDNPRAYAAHFDSGGSPVGTPVTLDLSPGEDEFQSALVHGNNVLVYGLTATATGNALVLVDYQLCE